MRAAGTHERDDLCVRGREHDRIRRDLAARVVVAVDETFDCIGAERIGAEEGLKLGDDGGGERHGLTKALGPGVRRGDEEESGTRVIRFSRFPIPDSRFLIPDQSAFSNTFTTRCTPATSRTRPTTASSSSWSSLPIR